MSLESLTREQLQTLVWSFPTAQVAKQYGTYDKAVERRCKALGIYKPPPGYWTKIKAKQQ